LTKQTELKKPRLVSWIVFLATLTVVLITLTTVVFPAFVMGSIGGIKYPVKINIFETGIWTYQLLAANFILLATGLLYSKNKLPQQITKSIRFIFNFEVSAKIAFMVITILLAIYVAFNISELWVEDPWEDFGRIVKPTLEKWTIDSIIKNPSDTHLVYVLGIISMKVFGYYTVTPFIASIALLILTYYITKEISQKRFAGIVSMAIVLQSGNFLIYDTTITYPNFWTLFYLLSLYLIYKKWPLSPVSYILSIPAKALTAAYLPMSLFFIYRTNIPRQRKLRLLICYGAITVFGVIGFFTFDILPLKGQGLVFNFHEFWAGFTAFSYESRHDGLVIMLLLPVTVGLFIAARKGIANTDSVMVLIMGVLLLAPMITGLTGGYDNNPYRFIPLIVFVAMGVGTILSKRVTEPV